MRRLLLSLLTLRRDPWNAWDLIRDPAPDAGPGRPAAAPASDPEPRDGAPVRDAAASSARPPHEQHSC